MFRPDTGIVEARRDGVRLADLSMLVLQQQRSASVQDAWPPVHDRGGIPADLRSGTPGLDAKQRHGRVSEECVEQPDRVRASADARDCEVRQGSGPFLQLGSRLSADHGL